MQFTSPLRYPGGKRKLAQFITDVIVLNDIIEGTYVEPFAGGASVALTLLFSETVNRVIINDIDRSIYAFWYSVLNDTERLCQKIKDTPITVFEWENQKRVQSHKNDVELFDLGFSTFFLNRTNRSGIIKGGLIGGRNQDGNWSMDARFNKDNLIKRIEKIALYQNKIGLYGVDAIDFIKAIKDDLDEHTLIYFDPPYYNQGSALYVNHYTDNNHRQLASFIQGLDYKWVLTYDYTPQILEMYGDVKRKLLSLNYTAAKKGKGHEMLAFSDGLIVPQKKYSSITIE